MRWIRGWFWTGVFSYKWMGDIVEHAAESFLFHISFGNSRSVEPVYKTFMSYYSRFYSRSFASLTLVSYISEKVISNFTKVMLRKHKWLLTNAERHCCLSDNRIQSRCFTSIMSLRDLPAMHPPSQPRAIILQSTFPVFINFCQHFYHNIVIFENMPVSSS